MRVEGVTRARATQANKPTQAALFLLAGVDRQLVQLAKPIGYDLRIAERQERAAAAVAAAASSASAPTDAAASAQTTPTQLRNAGYAGCIFTLIGVSALLIGVTGGIVHSGEMCAAPCRPQFAPRPRAGGAHRNSR
jgi:hypothetical protein